MSTTQNADRTTIARGMIAWDDSNIHLCDYGVPDVERAHLPRIDLTGVWDESTGSYRDVRAANSVSV